MMSTLIVVLLVCTETITQIPNQPAIVCPYNASYQYVCANNWPRKFTQRMFQLSEPLNREYVRTKRHLFYPNLLVQYLGNYCWSGKIICFKLREYTCLPLSCEASRSTGRLFLFLVVWWCKMGTQFNLTMAKHSENAFS